MEKPILIAGAGPVGLTLALLLQRQGRNVQLFEAVDELKPLGVGINLLPHSVRVLYDLDLGPKLDAVGIRTSALHYYNKFGQPIWAEPRGLDAGYHYPQYSIHRGELQMLLLEEVKQQVGEDRLHTGHQLVDWQSHETGISATFNTTAGETKTIDGACLIAADGIKSTARKKLYPNEGDPIYGCRILWRGVTIAEPFLDGSTMFMAGHQDCKFVAYPIAELPDQPGKMLINWIAELSVPDWQQDEQDWNKEVAVETFNGPFAGWQFPWVDIPALIQHCEHVYEFPLADRDPLPRWTHGHMTLIGDAAHPMYPIGSNGASQGILDAEAMAKAFASHTGVADVFASFEEERRPATAKIVLLNRKNGPEQVMQIAEERAPNGFDNIHDVIAQEELESIAALYKQTAGFSVEAVNKAAAAQKAEMDAMQEMAQVGGNKQ